MFSTGSRITFLLLAWAFFLLIAIPDSARADEPLRTSHTLEWLDEMAEYFEQNPELKETRSSGWKPYNRVKW